MLYTFLVIVLSLILCEYILKRRRYDMTAAISGPAIFPLIGTWLIFRRKTMQNSMKILTDLSIKYGDYTRVWVIHRLSVIIRKPDALESLLSSSKHITKGYLYNFLAIWLGDGLLLSMGSKWHSRRKIITPTFHFKILEEFVEIFDCQSRILVEKLEKHLNYEAFNIYPYVTLAALDVVCETAMGAKVNAQIDPNCEYVRAVAEISTVITLRFMNVWLRSDLLLQLLNPKLKKRQDQAVQVLHNFTENVIDDRRKLLLAEQEMDKENTNILSGSKRKHALLDALLKSTINGKPLSNADIREEVDTFMFEGHDTTTSAMCFTLYCLSRHPEIQTRALQEICHVIGKDKTKEVTFRDLQDLKYLECVIKEGLRLYPSVPIIAREIREDTKIGDYLLPAGTSIYIPIFVMLKDPKIFSDPDAYKPERHLLENSVEKMNPYAFIPFSAGSRNCIGQKFAMLEMKSTISKVLRYYELLPRGPDPIPVINIVMKSMNGIHIGIKEREY